jgi:putative isomerase
MAYWAARACLNYGRKDAARLILEKALDDSAKQFRRTGTIWEFYHPLGGHPEDVQRKPNTKYNVPSRDYLGHNPLLAMARLYDSLK